ncbi:(p)ppGpp synthetase I SpoT/RelA domain containing protein [Nitzschia inconspicua]|uniref:Putative GTP diphosphokinase RSH1, chloroplastic n=1 Tax=Nitzschia inconspicua TaxID=303405 RepID=A0A9K3LGV8_9STRA|nr:(p)ppGpp synthetase I SpoT/RelA domain containing protein [Nitzschia inconspicua]
MGHGISSGYAPLHLFQPNGAGFDDTNNNNNNNINSDNFNPFPSMMNELNSRRANNTAATTASASSSSSSSTSTTSTVIVDSSSPGFVPTNGLSEKINGYTTSARNGESFNGYSVSGEYTNGISQSQQQPEPQTAPEVNNWTSIMKSGLFFRKKKKVETVDGIYKELCDMSRYDVEQVDGYWEKLLPAVSYLGTEKVAKVYDALRVAYRAHRGQARKSGEPFIIHPVEVATLLAGLRMDEDTVMAGLLHDTVEDTDMTFELIQEMFGETVRAIVEGETKVSKLPKLAFSDYADEQAENLRQMFVAMTDDYRIIIVKLADRLHNMRTLKFMKPEKQVKISRETLDIFAPLAHRMGIWQFKSELEDTAFMYLYPQEYKRLSRRLRLHQTKFEDTLEKSQKLLKERLLADPTLRDQTANVQVSGRMKEIYSLWHKMETKQEQNLDHILDVVALRVIITPKADPDYDDNDSDRGVWLCYHVLGLVQHLEGFQPVPTRVKDYISFPKPNGYQSLHTALILNGQKIEVQIRTSMMHQVAEYGMASHWAYTDGKRRLSGQGDLYNTPWLSSIKEWQNEKLNARDFVDSVRNELLGKRVFVFLRNGKILNLARGATAIDAAFQIHSEVGLNMHGVEINGKPVPVSYELQNGDVVSILTGEGRPSIDWMRYAKSRSTRSRLRTYFRTQQKQSLWEAGKILLMDYLWMHGPLIEKSSYIDGYFAIPTTIEEVAAMLPGNTQFEDMDDLLVTIGKQNDRSLLHSFVSKLFKVPQKLLVQAEKNRSSLVPKSVLDAVHDRRRNAEIAAAAAASAQSTESPSPEEQPTGDGASKSNEWPKPSNSGMVSVDRILSTGLNSTTEFADPEHLCIACLPVYGDEIVGTRPEDAPHDSIPKVHRLGCPHAQRAINRALAGNQRPGTDVVNYEFGQRVDSETLRRSVHSRYQETCAPEVPVKLEWPEFAGAVDSEHYFPCEIVVHAEDRKLLLADCSEIVSKLSEIIKTGSQTTNEHATLVFLIKIQSLDDLQKVMNSLRQIRSVMAVERRFGSELIGVSFP